jgi:thioester reductase-like protein
MPNGKLDRRALPQPAFERNTNIEKFAPPQTSTELTLAEIWSAILGVERIGVNDNFFDIGGHSIKAIQIVSQIQDRLKVDLSIRELFMRPTIAGLSDSIERAQGTTNRAEQKMTHLVSLDDTNLDPSITASSLAPSYKRHPGSILLTGATGFLGAFLLHELLEQTQAEIYCLVRAGTQGDAYSRVQQNLEDYSLWMPQWHERLKPVTGDLSKPLLGCAQQDFEFLADRIDVIYHNGALVNFVYPYEILRAANVLGTQEILKLACRRRLKPVHYVSTLGIFAVNSNTPRVVDEASALPETSNILDDYSRSKLAAERMIHIARSRGIPTNVYRPGTIAGHSQTGCSNKNDFLDQFIRTCIQLAYAPELALEINIAPVDYVSRAIVYLSQDIHSLNGNFHLCHPDSIAWEELVAKLCAVGHPIEQCSYQKWKALLQDSSRHSADSQPNPFLSLLSDEQFEKQLLRSDNMLEIKCDRTTAKLAEGSIVYPSMDVELLRHYYK